MAPGFVHLNIHSEFSLCDSVVRIKKLVQALDASMPAVAVTDQCNMFALVKFYRAAINAGVKPIAGVDVRIANAETDDEPTRAILLVNNNEGYRNLTQLVSRAFQEGQVDGEPVMQRDWLFDKAAGIIVLSGGIEGEVGVASGRGRNELALSIARQWQAVFGDRFYLELRRTGKSAEEPYNRVACDIAQELGIPVVATNDVRFLQRDEHAIHEARVCIQSGYVLADPNRPKDITEEQYLKSAEEMQKLFSDIPEAIENTLAIAQRCNLNMTLGNPVLPDFPIPAGQTESGYFAATVKEGLEARLDQLFDRNQADFDAIRKPYDERLTYELGVITEMGFAGYFLIVADFIRWSRENDVPVGPGRGSGAGSLVAYSLWITDLDPLAYDLLFERFLNVERVSMPDFDIDFCMDGRDRVIQYVAQTYGEQKVSQIITYGTMAAKAVVRDVGRVMSQPYGFVDRIAKMVPFEVGMTLTKALAESEDLSRSYREDEEVTELLDMALALEGLARNAGKHAGGVVIAPTSLTDFTPLYCESDGSGLVTQFDKDDAEAVGLVKFDFLGLRTLTIIDSAVKNINETAAEPLDIATLPLDDEATYKLLQAAKTTAVFQLESAGMKRLIERLRPDNFEDIIALVALYRPGPLQSGMVDDFIDRKHRRKPLAWPHENYQLDSLKPVLEPTYGVILYQEQVMQIAQVMAGYSLGTADILRRAMGKKKPEEMALQRSVFLDGCDKGGIDKDLAGNIFDLVEKFAGYGFNKSHSAAYALLSYQTAWLKQHYPAAFMCAVLSADMDNTDKVVVLIEECASMKLRVLSPDINESIVKFSVVDEKTVRYGLGAIKGVGESALASLLEERQRRGPFTDLVSLARRADPGSINKRVMEALIRSGAADSLGENRATLFNGLPLALHSADQFHRDQAAGQNDLFGLSDAAESVPEVIMETLPEWNKRELLIHEKETLGLYLSDHPINEYLEELARFTSGRIAELCAKVGADQSPAPSQRYRQRGTPVILSGLSIAVRVRETSNGKMGFITLDDRSGRVDVVLNSELLEQVSALLSKDTVLIVDGDLAVDEFNGGYAIRAREVYDLAAARARFARRLIINITHDALRDNALDQLLETLSAHRPGRTPVCFEYVNGVASARIKAGNDWLIDPACELLDDLHRLAGDDAVELQY
ncbi:MAG: DNA polymerase III subunit alpha [Gammaproteobacteria bacterium]|nr:DNA polymerase III subunit alpha [Gammaproteobacteria bacterium]